jgi:hypothetical protein
VRYELLSEKKLIKEVVKVARSQVGLKELTGSNDGPHIEKYLNSVGLHGRYPYCAAGIYWCFVKATKNLQMQQSEIPIKRTASANAIFDDAKRKGNLTIYIPKTGDLLVWKLPKSYSGHIEIIVRSINVGIYLTIGFNTSSGNTRDGEGNYYRYRSIFDPIGRLNVRGIVGFWYE